MKNSLKLMSLALLAVALHGASAQAIPLATSDAINFDGDIALSCSFSAESDGSLAASIDNLTLSSALSGGTSGAVSVLSNGAVDVTFAAASFSNSPAAYTGGAETQLNVGSGFATGNQVLNLGAGTTTIDLDARATSSTIFPEGSYTLTTTATCAAPQITASSENGRSVRNDQ